jgi:phage terminase large subunit GpA-like protein
MLALDDASFVDLALRAGLRPDPLQTIADWADAHMLLPSWSAEPGPWRTSRTPYLREIMDCLSPLSPVRRVVFMKCAQIGGTSCGQNWIGYVVHRAPAAMLIVEPTVDVAKKLSKQKIQPMFDTVPVLKGKVKEARSRDSGNTILAKDYLGGMLVLTGANSGVGLRFMSAQYLFLDEVDAYPYDVDGEGPPVAVAEKRALTYARHKIYLCSTPVLKQTSVIEPEYEASDQRRYQVPCPVCQHSQILRWSQLKWPDGKPEQAQYQCESCLAHIPEHHKTAMLAAGRWVATYPERLTAGFHLNALYAPYGWVNSWAYLAKEWVRIIHKRDRGQQQTFINTHLAETWEDMGEHLNHSEMAGRREAYAAPCPEGVVVLTAAVDVQDNRLECECVGWGVDEESWSIDYQRFNGSPAQPDVWAQLDTWRQQTWQHEADVPMKIVQLAIDTGGHHAQEAYAFVKPREKERVCATKGSNQPGHPLVGRPTKSNFGKVNLFAVGTDTAKDTLFARLQLSSFGPGYCHFPDLATYDDEYFAQLASEEKRSKYERGVLQGTVYKKIRARNEALDLKVLNMAALAILNPNLKALAKQLPARTRPITSPAAPVEPPPKPIYAPPLHPRPAVDPFRTRARTPYRTGGFTKGWR